MEDLGGSDAEAPRRLVEHRPVRLRRHVPPRPHDRQEYPVKPYNGVIDIAVRERGRGDSRCYFPHGLNAFIRHAEVRSHPHEPGERLPRAVRRLILRHSVEDERLLHNLKPREAHVAMKERIKLIEPGPDVSVLLPGEAPERDEALREVFHEEILGARYNRMVVVERVVEIERHRPEPPGRTVEDHASSPGFFRACGWALS